MRFLGTLYDHTVTFRFSQSPGDCHKLKVELQNQPTGGELPFNVRRALRRHSDMLMIASSAVINEGLRYVSPWRTHHAMLMA